MANQISLPCNGTLLPTKADLVNIFTQLTSLSVDLSIEEDLRNKVKEVLDDIESLLGNFPISLSDPVYGTLVIPELEWERRITALLQEYHLYVQVKILEIIDSVLPVDFEIQVAPGLSVDILALFSDPGYRANLKNQICEDLDTYYSLIVPADYRTFAGEFGLDSSDIRCEVTWSNLMGKLNVSALGVLHNILGALIDKFKEIWDALGLPELPDLATIDVEELVREKIESLREDLRNAPDDLKQEIRDQIESSLLELQIGPFSLEEIIGGELEDKIVSSERKIDRFLEGLRDFGQNWPKYLLLKWMETVKKFFDAIGLGALFEWVTFDWCDFLGLIGFPTTISLPDGITVALPDSFSGALESAAGISETVENYVNPPAEGS